MDKQSLPSEKLKRDFGWMLNKVADYLSKNDSNKIALAERLPKSMIDPESEGFQVTILYTLEERGKFGPLNPDGLIEILKKVSRSDAVSEVKQYKAEQRYKKERELYKPKKRPKGEECRYENKEEVEKLVAEAKSKTFSFIEAKMKELRACEEKAGLYKSGVLSIEELRESFARFSTALDANDQERQSRTSSMSSRSTSSSEGSARMDDVDDDYEELSTYHPVQETQRDGAPQGRLSRPIPLPRRSKPPTDSSFSQPRPRSNAILNTALPDERDFTGGTGDSGVGTGESDRMAWIKDSHYPVLPSTNPVAKQRNVPPPVPPRPHSSGYMTLCNREERAEGEGYTQPLRLSSIDDVLDQLQQRQ